MTAKRELTAQSGGTPVEASERKVYSPYCDIYEREDGVVLLIDVPGATEKSIDLEIDDNTLSISAAVQDPLDKSEVARREFHFGDYERSFTLPETVDTSKIEAALDQGVLTVTLPKAEAARPRKITVK